MKKGKGRGKSCGLPFLELIDELCSSCNFYELATPPKKKKKREQIFPVNIGGRDWAKRPKSFQ